MRLPRQREYTVQELAIPVIWEILFIIGTRVFSGIAVYINFIFLLGIVLLFRQDFSPEAFFREFHDVRGFWVPVFITAGALTIANVIKDVLSVTVFLGDTMGMTTYIMGGRLHLLIYTLSSIFLMPLAHCLLSQAIIRFDTPLLLAATTFLSMLLFALTRAIGWQGIIEVLILSAPLAVSYVVTRNFHIPLAVGFIYELVKYAERIVYLIARMELR